MCRRGVDIRLQVRAGDRQLGSDSLPLRHSCLQGIPQLIHTTYSVVFSGGLAGWWSGVLEVFSSTCFASDSTWSRRRVGSGVYDQLRRRFFFPWRGAYIRPFPSSLSSHQSEVAWGGRHSTPPRMPFGFVQCGDKSPGVYILHALIQRDNGFEKRERSRRPGSGCVIGTARGKTGCGFCYLALLSL